jgi:hypothetical protein
MTGYLKKDSVTSQIIRLLKEEAERTNRNMLGLSVAGLTAGEIARRLGKPIQVIGATLAKHHGRRFYIGGYVRSAATRWAPSGVWKLGQGPDMPKPPPRGCRRDYPRRWE